MTHTTSLRRVHRANSGAGRTPRAIRAGLAALFLFYGLSMAVLLVLRGTQVAERQLILTPFETITHYFTTYDLRAGALIINIWGNIITFMPLGMLLQVFLKNKNVFLSTLLVALSSFMAEALQYIFMVGVTDIDDLILNTLGGILGILVYRIAHKLFKTQKWADTALLVTIALMCLVIVPTAFQQFMWGWVN